MFDEDINIICNKMEETELVSKFKNISKGKIIIKGDQTSKFSSTLHMSNISKFSELPMNIKSDLDMPIPLSVELWFLKEGPNRDGIITFPELICASERASGANIIPFHNMDDMDSITTYNLGDECGVIDNGRIDTDEDGVNWAVADARITNRNIAYQMYLRKLKGKPIEISAEYKWRPQYSDNGNTIQTFIRPSLISLVNSGHIKGNKIVIKSNI